VASSRVGDRQQHVLVLLDPLNVPVNDLQLRRVDLIVGVDGRERCGDFVQLRLRVVVP
jgi:hypothetical protein